MLWLIKHELGTKKNQQYFQQLARRESSPDPLVKDDQDFKQMEPGRKMSSWEK
jgi:hypothetical protein